MKKIVYLVFVLAVVGGLGLWLGGQGEKPQDYSTIATYEQCASAGFAILETFPEQCALPDGRTFTRVVSNEVDDLIYVDVPSPLAFVTSPFNIGGAARGSWYFEASFPVQLVDAEGVELFSGPATAQGEWMTSDFVPFTVRVTFKSPRTSEGTLILRNDNPSGLAENAKELRIPVRFATTAYRNVNFDAPFTLKIGDRVGFENGLIVELKKIDDSRCQPGVQCIWAGELSPVLMIGEAKDEVRLGTTQNTSLTYGSHTFTLKSATEKEAIFIVSKASSGTATNGVSGYVHVGPTCPVETVPADPKCADKPNADATVLIRMQKDGQIVDSLTTDAGGRFRTELIPGEYVAEVDNEDKPFPTCETEDFKVKAGGFTSIDISCDSGIR